MDLREERKIANAQARSAALQDEINRLQKDHDRVLSALGDAVESVGKPKKRRGRFLFTLVVAGAAYVFGAKAGRTRYEQIMDRFGKLFDRTKRQTNELKMQEFGTV